MIRNVFLCMSFVYGQCALGMFGSSDLVERCPEVECSYVLPSSQSRLPGSILRLACPENAEKNKKRVQWSSMADQMIYEKEQEYDYVSQEGSDSEVEQSVVKTGLESDLQANAQPVSVSYLKKSCLLPNDSYRTHVNGQIVIAVEKAKEKKEVSPLTDLSQYFMSLLFEAGTDDTERPLLEEALEVIAQESWKLSGEPEVQEIPVCKPLPVLSGQSHSVSPTLETPIFSTVLLLPEAPINPTVHESDDSMSRIFYESESPKRPCEQPQIQRTVDDEAFEIVLKEAITKKDQGLLELLKGVVDLESEQYKRVREALESTEIE